MNNCKLVFYCDVTNDCDFKKGNDEDHEANCDFYNAFNYTCENKASKKLTIKEYIKNEKRTII